MKICNVARKSYEWGLDYVYVTKWQVRAFFFSNTLPLPISPQKRHPILLIPGIYENWHFMWPIITLLASEGYSIHVIEKLGYNTKDIPYAADEVKAYVKEYELQNVIIIAHSKGGLIAKYAMIDPDVSWRIKHLIAINTPFSGSLYAYFFLLPHIRTFIPSGAIIRHLKQNTDTNSRITSIHSAFDPHIPSGSFLEGATNISLPLTGHFRIVGDRRLLDTVVHLLARL